MELRKIFDADTAMVRKLWASSFEKEGEPFYEWFFAERYRPEQAVGAFDGQELLAALHMMPYSIYLRGAFHATRYIMGVAVFPRYRGQGIFGQLMAASLQEMNQAGIALSVLQPVVPSLYVRYGWDICYHYYKYNLPADWLKTVEAPGDYRIVDADRTAFADLEQIYEANVQGRHGFLRRRPADWEVLLSETRQETGQVQLLCLGGQARAYAVHVAYGGRRIVKELAYTDAAAGQALLQYLFSLGSASGRIELHLPPDDAAFLRFCDYQDAITLQPFIAARIVNIASVLENSVYPPGVACSLRFKCIDSLAPWNNGCFELAVTRGRGTLRPVQDNQVELTIGALSLLVFGRLSASNLVRSGQLQADKAVVGLLDSLWPPKENYITEMF